MAVILKKLDSDGHYYVKCDFEERHIPKDAGFGWHPERKLWYTEDPFVACKLIEFAEPGTRTLLENKISSFHKSGESGSALDIPVPDGLEYFPYQKAGIEWCVNKKAALVADEMGLGKTIQAIGTANYLGLKSMLVICPATLKLNWQREIERWHVLNPRITVVNGTRGKVPLEAEVVIINYDILSSPDIKRQLHKRKFQLVVMDEAHYLKNPKAKRTQAVLGKDGIAMSGERFILLTGTPVLNRPIDLHTLLAAFSPETIRPYNNYWSYAKKFCGAYKNQWGWQLGGASAKEELNKRLRSTIMIRRMKKSVLAELPDKQYQLITFEQDAKTKSLVKQEHTTVDIKNFNAQGLKLQQDIVSEKGHPEDNSQLGELARMRRDMSIAKLPVCMDHIKELYNDGADKIVVFAHHKVVIAALKEKFGHSHNPVVITGETPQIKRQEAVDRFQTDPEVKMFIGNIRAAGVGITLTAASLVVFVETTWVPGEVDQAVDRCHRIGQKDSVLAQFLVVKDSLDEHIMRTIIDKRRTISKIVDEEHANQY